MTHIQQFVGICTSPIHTFDQLAKGPVKHSLWIFPLVCTIIVTIFSNILLKSNSAIQSSARENSMRTLENQLEQAVERGSMTAQQKEEQLREIERRLSHEEPSRFISQSAIISAKLTLNFFIASCAFFVCAKYVLGGKGKYINALIAYASPLYILMLQSIVVVIISTVTGISLFGTNLACLLNEFGPTFGGFLLSRIDPFLLWFYGVVGIGFAKMFSADGLIKYLCMTALVWLGSGILIFFAARVFPILHWIVGM